MKRPLAPTVERALSLEAFERLPEEDEYRLELVHGRLVHGRLVHGRLVHGRLVREPAPAPRHGRVSVDLSVPLATFVKEQGLGVVLVNVGFVLAEDPPTVRVPDLAFVARDRIPAKGYDAGSWHIAPDLAIEILSPLNTDSESREKSPTIWRRGAGSSGWSTRAGARSPLTARRATCASSRRMTSSMAARCCRGSASGSGNCSARDG